MDEMTPDDRAFAEGAALLDLARQEAVLDVAGPDAADYLQRMVSADLRKVTATAAGGAGRPATLMTAKGRLVAAFTVHRVALPVGARFRVVVERSALAPLREALERLVILEEVVFDEPALAVLSVQGPGADRALHGESAGGEPLPAAALESVPLDLGAGEPALLVRRPRCRAGGWDILVPEERAAALAERLRAEGAVDVDTDAIERHRVLAGIPRFGVDGTSENLAPEAGYEDAIAYDKGCYAGQEVVARIRTYGHVNRRLCLLRLAGSTVPECGAEIRAPGADDEDGQRVGAVTSAALAPGGPAYALGFVRYKLANEGQELEIDGAGEARVERVVAEWFPN